MGLFGGGKAIRDKAIEFISSNLRMQLGPYIKFGNLVDVVAQDAYVAGYIYGKIIGFIFFFVKSEGMPESDTNMVTGMVLLKVFGETQARAVSDAMKAFAARQFPEFVEGKRRGSLITAYAVGAQDIQRDPEYAKALASFRELERRVGDGQPSDDHWAAVTGLEGLWFGNKLEKGGW